MFNIGPVPIRAYGFMLCVALVVALIRTIRVSDRTEIKREHVVDIGVYCVLAGVVFAHIASILLTLHSHTGGLSNFLGNWGRLLSPEGGVQGLSFHGGLAGGILVGYLYTRIKKISFLRVADLFSPGLALGYAIARIGCFLNGCCYGIHTHLPWGMRFDTGGGVMTAPSHPTQLYSVLAGFGIYLLLAYMDRRRHVPGQVFLGFLAVYSVYRFLLEFLRKGVTAEVSWLGLTQAQIASAVVLVVALLLLHFNSRRPVGPDAASAPTREGKAKCRS